MAIASQIETSTDRNVKIAPSPSERSSSRKLPAIYTGRDFCRNVVAITLVGLVCVGMFNFLIDPFAQYGSHFVAPVVQPSRAEKLDLLSVESPIYDSMVVGSSRVMKLEPDWLNKVLGGVFFNGGVNHGRPEDFLALKRWFASHHGRDLKKLIIGVDEVSFLEDAFVDARLISHPQLVAEVPEARSLPGCFRRWQQLLGWQQTMASIRALKAWFQGLHENPKQSFQSDGLLVYHDRERQLAEGTYDFDAAIAYNELEYVGLMHGYERLSPQRMDLFRLLLDECQREGIEVTVFATPLHPALRSHLLCHTESYRERYDDMIQFVRDNSNAFGAHFVDLTCLDAFDGNADAFVDGIHPLEANTRKMIQQLRQQGERRNAVQ